MQEFPMSPVAAVKSITSHWQLIAQLTARDIASRYRGSVAGIAWSLLGPLLSLAMYTFVFGVVLQARWGTAGESTFDFALTLFAGLVLHGLLAEVLTRAPYLIIGNPSYVKQVVFPLDTLPFVSLLSALFNAGISLVLLLLFWSAAHGGLYLASLLIPFLVLPMCLIALGIGWMLAATTVYFRDIAQLVAFISAGLLFMSPIFYPASAVPEPIRPILNLNPLTFVIESVRAALIFGTTPPLTHYALYSAVSLLVASAGFAWFQRLRTGFGDVI